MGHGRVVRMLNTAMGGVFFCEILGPGFHYWHPAKEAIRTQSEFTLLPLHRDIFSCHLHTEIIVLGV